MLKKWAILLSPDANTDSTSSNESDDNGQDSSPEQQDATGQAPEGETTEDGDTATDDGEGEDSSDSATGKEAGDQQEQPDKKITEEKEEAPVVTDKPEDTKLDFHKHPRFQELVTEKNAARTELEQLKPAAERAQVLDNYLQSNGIAPQQFTEALEYLRLLKTNPTQALEMLRPSYEALQMLNGEKLPADIEAKVAAGMDVETARELARLRVQSQRQQSLNQDQGAVAAQQFEHMINSSFSAFDQMKRSSDPDFRPKKDQSLPDGKWEFVNSKLLQLRMEKPPRNTAEAQALAKEAYDQVNKSFASFAPKKPVTRRPIGSQNSSQNSNPVVKTAEDVVKAIMAGKRPNELRYS